MSYGLVEVAQYVPFLIIFVVGAVGFALLIGLNRHIYGSAAALPGVKPMTHEHREGDGASEDQQDRHASQD